MRDGGVSDPMKPIVVHKVKRGFTKCGLRTSELPELGEYLHRYVVIGDWDEEAANCKECKAASKRR